MDLRLENLTKLYDGKLAIEIPSLTIRDREFFTFVGPSGCGKSTTLNLIAGLQEPASGKILLGERLLNDLPPHKRNVAFVFQSYALYPHRTVFENLSFPLELAGAGRDTIRQRVEEAASLLGLASLLEKRPWQLSGGERQRVALGRALVRQPHLFLLDEPLSNLDAPLRAQMRKELKRLHQKVATTFLYVTHDQEEALSLSDRIAVIRSGRIQQCGTPREIYDQPANLFVASFFGAPPMNLFQAELLPGEPGPCLSFAGQKIPVGLPAGKAGPVTAGIRPEHLQVMREAAPGTLAATVSFVELHGGQAYLELSVQDSSFLAARPVEEEYKAGEPLWLRIPPEKIHWFDPDSGTRLAS